MADANRERPEADVVVEEQEASAPADASIARLLEHVSEEAVTPEAAPSLRTARVVSMAGGGVQITWRGLRQPIEAELDEGWTRSW